MKHELLEFLRCPLTKKKLFVEVIEEDSSEIITGTLFTEDRQNQYPIKNGIPRFVPESNYADNFGMQWNMFRATQLDSYSEHPISENRFWSATNWSPDRLKEKWVLDCGCGAGRFAEVALKAGANVVALDYSSAVDACRENLKHFQKFHIIQADIYYLPLLDHSFDYVYSLGVLQHTPDVEKAVKSLPVYLRPAGKFCIDFYEKSFKSALLPKYWLRPFTKKMDKTKLFKSLQKKVPFMLSLSILLGRIPVIGNLLKRIIPVANYKNILPLNDTQLKEWALLDTFDWLSPEYDNPQNSRTIRKWLEDCKLNNIEIVKASHLVGRGTAAI